MSVRPAPPRAAGLTRASACAAKEDIIDETLKLFRAQVFFKNFEIKTPADLTLTYLILFTQQCIQTCQRAKDAQEGHKLLHTLGAQDFAKPGEAAFPLGGFVSKPQDGAELDRWGAYFKDLRQETCKRVLKCLFNDDGTPNKWWMCFAKKKFLGMELQ